jgi:hypothetical protein
LQERPDAGLIICVVRAGGQEYADQSHPLRLLRVRGKRPHDRRAAEK